MARPIARLTARLLAAACIGVATAALAQDGATAPREPVYFAAARAVYDGNARTVTLSGGVEFASGGRLLRADQVIYDEAANRAVATGNVSVTEPDGRSATADRLELTGDLKDGLIENIGVVFDENARMAARRATREKGTLTTLFDAVFSPCRVCVEKGHVSPLWSISAVRIVHDAERKTVSYEDATFRVFDSPILTIPAFEHADPSVGRVSGFLSPDAGSSSDIGYFVKVPYYFALAPNYDLTLAPLAATEANPVLFAEWRHRTSSGEYAFSGSYTYDEDRDPFGAPTGTGTSYGHIFGRGRFKLDESYGWGFDVERVSDDTYLERYDISNADRLTSRLFGDWRDGLSYGTISAFAFQGLRSTDDPGLTPVVAPWAELSWVMSDPWMGGAVQLDASAVALTRARGRDVQRASASAQWRLPLIFEGGQAVTFFALGRGDVYRSVEDGREAEVAARLLGHIGIDARWPFVRDGGGGSIQVLEPIAQIVLAPYGDGDDSIPNEDSLSIEFDDTNLFSPVKFPGLDRWEGGPRANLGLRFAHFEADGAFFEVLAGAEFRLEADRTLPGAAGLGGTRSDLVGRITWEPVPGLRIVNRLRLDESGFAIRRNELYVQGSGSFYSIDATYLKLAQDAAGGGEAAREEVDMRGRLFVGDHWSLVGAMRRDLAQDRMIESRLGVAYEDECSFVELGFRRRFTRDRDAEPGTTFVLSVRLKALGDDTESPDSDPYLGTEIRDLRTFPDLR